MQTVVRSRYVRTSHQKTIAVKVVLLVIAAGLVASFVAVFSFSWRRVGLLGIIDPGYVALDSVQIGGHSLEFYANKHVGRDAVHCRFGSLTPSGLLQSMFVQGRSPCNVRRPTCYPLAAHIADSTMEPGMPEDPLDALAKAAAHGTRESTQARIDKERRTQTTARIVRRSLRLSMLGAGVSSIALLYFGTGGLQVVGAFGLLVALAFAVALFFMGGLAPARVRRSLSERERELLDD